MPVAIATMPPIRLSDADAGCDPPTDNRSSDLCAQWKAADAAANAAKWGKVGAIVGTISGIFVIIALGLAYQANAIARDTARRQLRAYITLLEGSVGGFAVGETPWGSVKFKNTGQTPAYAVKITTRLGFSSSEPEDEWFEIDEPPYASVADVGVGGEVTPSAKGHAPCNHADVQAYQAGALKIYIWGKISYKDTFSGCHLLSFRLRHSADVGVGEWQVCQSGNKET